MIWVLLLLGVVFAMAVPGLRKVILGLIGTIVALAVVAALILVVLDRQQKAERDRGKTLITQEQVEFVDLTLQPGYGGSSYTLAGRVRNRSGRYTVSELRLKVTMRDCDAANKCEVVGETEDAVYVTVPPGQARDLNEYIYFNGLGAARGKHQWDYEIVEIVGR
jgi:hypothetical protein